MRGVTVGRTESPVDPNAGPIAQFALALRQLRRDAGDVTYRQLAEATHYSVPTLSRAAGGQSLPTLEVTLAFVRACGGDPADWETRWRATAAALTAADPAAAAAVAAATADSVADSNDGPAAPPAESGRPGEPAAPGASESSRAPWVRRRRWSLVAGAVAGVALVAIAVVLAGYGSGSAKAPPATPVAARSVVTTPSVDIEPFGSRQPIADDSDPQDAGCDDAETIAARRIDLPPPVIVGQIELRYSKQCGAAWARFAPYGPMQQYPDAMIIMDTIRPVDHRELPFAHKYANDYHWSNMLLVGPGCVVARVTIQQAGLDPVTVDTQCKSGPDK
jgi:hypothetical protein